jgi:hexokinase
MKLSAQTTVGFNGGVIEKYPGYLNNCQQYIDQLVVSNGQAMQGSITLAAAKESSLLGAAVALACEQTNH